MYNFLGFVIVFIITYLYLYIFFKFFSKHGFYAVCSVFLILSNIYVLKEVNLFSFNTALGSITYAAIYPCFNIINEIYGHKKAFKFLFCLALSMSCFSIISSLYLSQISINDEIMNISFYTIFKINPLITFASLIAFFLSQLTNISIYDYLRHKYKNIIFSSAFSNIIAHLVDTFIFLLLIIDVDQGIYTFLIYLISRIIIKSVVTTILSLFVYKTCTNERSKEHFI